MERRLFFTAALCIFSLILGVGFLSAAEVTYEKDIRPMMEKRCFFCHGKDSPTIEEFDKNKEEYKKKMKGPRMDTYENLINFIKGADAGAIMRRLDDGKNTKDGKPGNMYVYLGSTDEERQKNLKTFKEWIGYWTLKKRADLTQEELKKFKIPKE